MWVRLGAVFRKLVTYVSTYPWSSSEAGGSSWALLWLFRVIPAFSSRFSLPTSSKTSWGCRRRPRRVGPRSTRFRSLWTGCSSGCPRWCSRTSSRAYSWRIRRRRSESCKLAPRVYITEEGGCKSVASSLILGLVRPYCLYITRLSIHGLSYLSVYTLEEGRPRSRNSPKDLTLDRYSMWCSGKGEYLTRVNCMQWRELKGDIAIEI